MTDPDVIDAEATEQMDEAPPERTATDLATGQALELAGPSGLRRHHQGGREIAGTGLPVVPPGTEIAALAQLAVTIAGANTSPRALQGNPNDAFMVLLTARDVGVGITTAIREFHVIDGKVTLSPKVKLAMVRQQGHGKVYPHQPPRTVMHNGEPLELVCPCGDRAGANDDTRATWHAERHDEPGVLHTSTFTLEMAQRVKAKENQRNITLAEKSTWQQYPQRMLSWRALGYLLDDVFSEVGTGLYSPDEMGAVTDEDGVPIIDVVGHADPVPGTRAPRGHKAPPPPPPEEATDEQRAAIKARIDALAVLPDARSALVALWTEVREGETDPNLPPVHRLLARQVKRAEAMVASVEARAKRGEWGDWDAALAAVAPQEGSDDGSGSEAPDGASEAQSGDDSATTGDLTPEQITRVVIAEVQAIPNGDEVKDQLRERGLSLTGNVDTLRHRLASAMIQERTGATDDDLEASEGDEPDQPQPIES